MSQEPHHIEVLGECEEEQQATGADCFVTVEGSSFFTGRSALTQAKEVAQLVQALSAEGIHSDQVQLQAVRTTTQNGLFNRSSSATYELLVRLSMLDQLGALLGVVGSAKQVTLERIGWRYPDDDQEQGRLLERATRNGLVKARAVASALGVSLKGPLSVYEMHHDASPHMQTFAAAPGMIGRARSAPADMGMEIKHERLVKRQVRLRFELS